MFRSACAALAFAIAPVLFAQSATPASDTIVLHAAHLLDVERGAPVSPGEVLVRGSRIVEVGSSVAHPNGAKMIELGEATYP